MGKNEEIGQLLENAVASADPKRRGHKIYAVNPSLAAPIPTRVKRSSPLKTGAEAYLVAPGTGEVVSKGAFGFIQEKEIDSEEFVKIYLAGIRKYGELSKAGANLFEFVYEQMSGVRAKDKDTVTINYFMAQTWKPDLTRATYFRGINELLTKSFLYRSVAADLYFVNVAYMFNGDRMVLVQSYRRKAPKKGPGLLQNELPLDEPGEAGGES